MCSGVGTEGSALSNVFCPTLQLQELFGSGLKMAGCVTQRIRTVFLYVHLVVLRGFIRVFCLSPVQSAKGCLERFVPFVVPRAMRRRQIGRIFVHFCPSFGTFNVVWRIGAFSLTKWAPRVSVFEVWHVQSTFQKCTTISMRKVRCYGSLFVDGVA